MVLVAQPGGDVDGARAAIEMRGWHAYHVHPEMPVIEALIGFTIALVAACVGKTRLIDNHMLVDSFPANPA